MLDIFTSIEWDGNTDIEIKEANSTSNQGSTITICKDDIYLNEHFLCKVDKYGELYIKEKEATKDIEKELLILQEIIKIRADYLKMTPLTSEFIGIGIIMSPNSIELNIKLFNKDCVKEVTISENNNEITVKNNVNNIEECYKNEEEINQKRDFIKTVFNRFHKVKNQLLSPLPNFTLTELICEDSIKVKLTTTDLNNKVLKSYSLEVNQAPNLTFDYTGEERTPYETVKITLIEKDRYGHILKKCSLFEDNNHDLIFDDGNNLEIVGHSAHNSDFIICNNDRRLIPNIVIETLESINRPYSDIDMKNSKSLIAIILKKNITNSLYKTSVPTRFKPTQDDNILCFQP